MKKLISLLLALCLAFGVCALGEEDIETITYAKVVSEEGGKSNMYILPGEYREVTREIDNGTMVYVLFEGSTWHKVKTVSGGYVGWMRADEINITTKGFSALTWGCSVRYTKVISSSDGFAALRWGPGTEYDMMDKLYNGTSVMMYETCGSWARVVLEDGRVGYVYKTLLKDSKFSENFPSTLYGYVQVTGNAAAFKKDSKTSAGSYGSLSSGTVVEVLGYKNYYMHVYEPSSGRYGYIHMDIISIEGINRTAVQTPLFYDDPYTYDADIIFYVPSNTTVKVLASDGYVSRVQYDTDIIGYVFDYALVY